MKRSRLLAMGLLLLLALAACGTSRPRPAATTFPTVTPTLGPPPVGVLLTLTRQGGLNNYCDELNVAEDARTSYRDTCRSTARDGQLAPTDMAFLKGLASRVWRYQYTRVPAQGDKDTTSYTLAFYGKGPGLAPTAGELARLLDIAQTAGDSLRAGTSSAATPEAVSLDAVRTLLASAHGDRNALRNAMAGFLALPEIRAQTDADAAAILQGLMGQAQVYDGAAPTVQIVRFGKDHEFTLVNHPRQSITLFGPSGWIALVEGTHIVDVRQQGDLLGVISLYDGQPAGTAYTLVRQENGAWKTLWNSADSPEWQTTDGSVAFAGEGIERLRVLGQSLSPMQGEADAPISECMLPCPRRYFSATWTLDSATQAYRRATKLAPVQAGQPLDAALWDMTEPDEYSLVYEFLHRLRAGDTAGVQQIATPEAIKAATAAGMQQRSFTANEQEYQLVYLAGRSQSGQIRLQPVGLRVQSNGQVSQAPIEAVYTFTVEQVGGKWQVVSVTQ